MYLMYKGCHQKSSDSDANGCDNSVDCSPLKSVKHYFISPTFLFSIHNSVASSMYRYRNNIIRIISYAAVYNTI